MSAMLRRGDHQGAINGAGGAHAPDRSRSYDPAKVSAPIASFAKMVEGEIIPRLLLAHRDDQAMQRASATRPLPTQVDIEAFTRLTLETEAHTILARVDMLMAAGMSGESVCLDLLAPSAQMLGTLWEQDQCDFVDVTMGLWRLQEVVHAMASRSPGPNDRLQPGRRALFTVPPGEQHGFGSIMVEEFFRRAGWSTWSAPTASPGELDELVSRKWFDLVGLTISCDRHIDRVPHLISGLREKSRNPDVIVMVGGRVFIEQPELVALVGADSTAPDGRQAVMTAEKLLDLVVTRSASLVAGRV